MSSITGDPEFILLKQPIGWLPESDWKHVLGAAVQNCWSPKDDCVPKNPLIYNKEQLTDLAFNDFVIRNDGSKTESSELSVQGLFKLRGAKSAISHFSLNGKRVFLKRIQSRPKFWKAILGDEEFTDPVIEWLGETTTFGFSKHKVFWVAGLLMCQDVTFVTSNEEVKERERRGDLLLGTVAELAAASQGIPLTTGGAGNVTAEDIRNDSTTKCFVAKSSGKYIFALEVQRIKSRKGQLRLTDEKPSAPSNRTLGHGDGGGSSDIEPEDLIPQTMDESEWSELLETIEA